MSTTGFSDIGAAVIGSGFIGTVHVEALRRLGVTVHGILGSSPDRADDASRPAGRGARIRQPRRAAGRPTRRRGPRDLAQPAALPPGQGHPGGGSTRRVREAPRRHLRRVRGAGPARRGERPDHRRQLQHPLLSPQPAPPRRGRAPGSWGTSGSSPAATSRTGCSWTPTGTGGSTRTQGGTLRAFGDIGTHWVDLISFITSSAGDLGDGRARHRDPGPSAADRARWRRSPPSAPPTPSRRPMSHRGHRAAAAALRQRRPRLGGHLPGEPRPQELAPVRGRWLGRAPRPGTRRRPTTSGSATATGPTRSCSGRRRS